MWVTGAMAISIAWLAWPGLTEQPPSAPAADPPRPVSYEERVEVVGVTPIHGVGLSRFRIPANVQVLSPAPLRRPGTELPDVLNTRAASVTLSDPHGGTFQPDVLFRGFVASPLLGASEGLAVYQDGVRINEPFGDTVNWDLLPARAIASLNLIPGSSALFGLNALGGAVSIRTKDGFAFPGHRAAVTTGSFGRHQVEAESGGHRGRTGYFLAGTLTHDAGWRDHSPSTIRRMFGDLAWTGDAHAFNLSITAAANDLAGNGAAPVGLLERQPSAVFTHPDETINRRALVTARARRYESPRTIIEGLAYYRAGTSHTFNGDAADDDDDDLDDEDDGHGFEAVNNTSRARVGSAGASGQLTWIAPLRGRDNQLIAGAALDTGATRFAFDSEWAHLSPDRGTIGTGLLDPEAAVRLHSRVTTSSLFVTNTWSPSAAVSLTASLRFNWTALRLRDQIGTALTGDHRFRRLNPAAGITWQTRPWLNVFGGYSESSRVPTPVELTCADPDDPCRLPNAFVADPPLKQVVGRTWEGGLRGRNRLVVWTIAAFATTVGDDLIFVSSGAFRGEGYFRNISRTLRRGLEISAERRMGQRLDFFAAYTLQRATYGTALRIASHHHPAAQGAEIAVSPGDRLPGVPLHSGKVGVAGRIGERWQAGADLRASSSQFLRGDESNELQPLPGFAALNVHARYRVTRNVAAVAAAHNVLDARFYTFGTLGDPSVAGLQFDGPRFFSPGAPRSARVGLELTF